MRSVAVIHRWQNSMPHEAPRAGRWPRCVPGRALLAGLACALAASGLPAQETPAETPAQPAEEPAPADEEKLPKLQEMEVPSAEALLTGTLLDWIVLKTGEVIVCESIVPRPDTLKLRQQELEAKMAERRGKTGAELDEINQQIVELGYLVITLPNEMENPEYQLLINRIDRIIHHEDLMLRRIDLLAQSRELETAYELLWRLARDWPAWPGIKERHDNVLFADGGVRLDGGNAESALVVLTELFKRAPGYAGLSERIGLAVDQIVTRALEARDFRQARYFLLNLDKQYPQHPVFQRHAQALAEQAQALLAAGEQARSAGRHAEAADLARQAAELWPRVPNLLARIKPLVERYQRLRVGVVHLPTEEHPSPYPTPAELRADHILRTPLFELDRVRGGSVYYRTGYFDEWEPYDLGRTLRMTMRQVRQPWESRPLVDAPSVAAQIERRIDPRSPEYDERLAGYVSAVQVESPLALRLTFRRVPARVEPLLDDLYPAPLAAASPGVESPVADEGTEADDAAGGDADEDEPAAPAAPTVAGGFVPVETGPDHVVFRRALPEPDGLPQYHVAELIERRYPSHEKALQALREGEVSVLPDLPAWIIQRLQADEAFQKEFFIQKYAVPVTHVVQFNPRSPAVRLRELRRALSYAIDRNKVLRETVLRDPQAALGRVSTGPFPSSSPGNSVSVVPPAYDLSSAIALVLAAGQQMENTVPVLRMIVPPGPVEQAAAADLVRAWKRIGLEVVVVEATQGAPRAEGESWDLHYRTVQLMEPTVDLWPFLTAAEHARVSDLVVFPDWLKQRLITVDRTSDLSRALDATRRLHEVLTADVRYVPLWEVDGYLVARKNIQGFAASPLHSYQHLDRWTVGAWFKAE